MFDRGKIVVIAIFALGLGMAGFAWWWNRQQGRRSLEFWGREAGLAIRDAKRVRLMKLAPVSIAKDSAAGSYRVSSRDWKIEESKDITGVPGLVHARHAFLEDASFRWDDPLSLDAADWQYAVQFEGKTGKTTILLALQDEAAASWEQRRAVRLSPTTAGGWKQFISRYFPDKTPASQPP